MGDEPVRVGVVGCGAISGAYLGMAKQFPGVSVVACADLERSRAAAAAETFGIARVLSVEELLSDSGVDLVLNLTVPKAHLPVAMKALQAGKHTYAEKPLGIDREQGKAVIAFAAERGLRVGCAPDTFMGSGIQTARKLVDDGAIGRPVAFTALMMGRGHEHWHENPEFYYEAGGGPMFDMGPYYLTALLNLLGPVERISGMATTAITDRTITSKSKFGKKISVETPDHVMGMMEFANGCAGTIIQSFATRAAVYDGVRPITVFGTSGTIKVPDPNGFDGTVELCRFGEEDKFETIDAMTPTGYGRSVGLADMAEAIQKNRPHRASGEQALAVLDLMQGFLDASTSGRAYEPTVRYERVAPMPAGPFGNFAE